jgi:peptide/nickel transport system permease protein
MRTLVFFLIRSLQLLLLALVAAFVTFWLSSLIPGDFFSTQILDPAIRKETVEQMRHQYGLDRPLFFQYLHWMKNLLQLDLGYSLFYQRPVAPIVADALLKSLWLGVPALILGIGSGIIFGSARGILGDCRWARVLNFVSATALSLPSLLLGLSALILAARTHWFPLGGMNSPDLQEADWWRQVVDRIYHLVLPVACLIIPIFASVERIQFSATRNSRSRLYLRSALSRGLGRWRLFFHYILRPGLNPVLSICGPMIGAVLSGSLVLEIIFSWPGLGQITYDALFNRDLFLLAGCIVGSSLLLVAGNLLADLALIAFDPRTRTMSRKGL